MGKNAIISITKTLEVGIRKMKLKNARAQKKRYIPVVMGCAKKSWMKLAYHIADSKLMTGDNLHLIMSEDVKIRCISRVPADFDKRLEERIVTKSYERDSSWEYISVLAENDDVNACEYWIQQWKEQVHGYSMNLVCVKSSAGAQRVSRKLAKLKEHM